MPPQIVALAISLILALAESGRAADPDYGAPSGERRPATLVRSAPLEVQQYEAASATYDVPDTGAPDRASESGSGIQLVQRPSRDRAAGSASRRSSPIFTVISSLAIVVGLFTLVAWAARKSMPKASAPLPGEVVQVLGRAPLAHRQNMHLVRVGRKLLLVCATPHGAETLTEIADPVEVDQICAACERSRPGSISATFRQVLAQVENERTTPGFLGPDSSTARAAKTRATT